jgi:alpha-glucuronidase|tara:strand:- start:3196 stop:3597 length:402 start_codon:yes stop_codon:yes gene_type:complete
MQRTLYLAILLVITPASIANAFTLAENGQAQAVIIVDANGQASRHAADELRSFLLQVTGADFPMYHQLQPGVQNVLVGTVAARMLDPDFSTEGLGEDGLVIRTVGDQLILAGGAPRWTLYAVYTFLEDHVGCH